LAVVVFQVAGRKALGSGGHDTTMRIRDATTSQQIGEPLTGNTSGRDNGWSAACRARGYRGSAGHDATLRTETAVKVINSESR
jgi:hypothetical protein